MVTATASTVSATSTAVRTTTASAATVEPATAVETSATAMRVGDVWLAEHSGAQQSGCDCQSPSDPALGSMLA